MRNQNAVNFHAFYAVKNHNILSSSHLRTFIWFLRKWMKRYDALKTPQHRNNH